MKRHARTFRRGLTQIELMIGLVITVMTVGALGAFMASAAQAWRSADEVQNAQVVNLQASHRIHETIKSAKYLGYAGPTTEGTAVMFWREDPNADGKMQLSEIGTLAYNSGDKKLTLYAVPATGANAATLCSVGDIDDAGDAATFKTLANVKAVTLLKDVSEVTFAAINPRDGAQRPSLKYKVRTQRGDKSYGETQAVALRAARSRPVLCDGPANCACSTTGCTCGGASSCGCPGDVPCRTNTAAHCKANVSTVFAQPSPTSTASATP